MPNKTRRNAANIAGRGRQRRPAPRTSGGAGSSAAMRQAQIQQLPLAEASPPRKETEFDAETARLMRMGQPPASPTPRLRPAGTAAPLVSSYSAPPTVNPASPRGTAAPLVSSYSAPPQGAGHYQGPADTQLVGSYAKGGKVRGYGMARGGKPCKMR